MKVYTFDTRDLIIWDMLKREFGLNGSQIYKEINNIFSPMLERLSAIGAPYEKLKNVLIPQKDKQEICFIFDSMKISSGDYGSIVFNKILPLITGMEKIAMFCGDLRGPDSQEGQKLLKRIMEESIVFNGTLNYKHSSQYFLVFINCVTIEKLYLINASLKESQFYVGYSDLTFNGYFKDIVASSINQKCLFYKKIVLLPVDENEYKDYGDPVNYSMIDYEKYGWKIKNVNQTAFSSFLSFKIHRMYHEFDIDDQVFSLNTVIREPMPINTYDIQIEGKKFQYLQREKLGVLSITGLGDLEIDQLKNLIRENINTNYIFNIEYNQNFECLKFNTFLDLYNQINANKHKYIVSFQVKNDTKQLRLITMF